MLRRMGTIRPTKSQMCIRDRSDQDPHKPYGGSEAGCLLCNVWVRYNLQYKESYPEQMCIRDSVTIAAAGLVLLVLFYYDDEDLDCFQPGKAHGKEKTQ